MELEGQVLSKIEGMLQKYDQRISSCQKIEFSELSKYSSWPARLTGLEGLKGRIKSRGEVLREFEKEKWGELLKVYKQKTWGSFREFRDHIDGPPVLMPRSWREQLFLLKENDFSQLQADFLADALGLFLPVDTVVELGCGFGAMLLDIAGRDQFSHVCVKGGDIAVSGVELLNIMAKKFGLSAHAHTFDLESFDTSFIPSGSVVYTSFSLSYVDGDLAKIVEKIIETHPKAVVHLEPIQVCPDDNEPLSLMRRRYLELNGYNGGLKAVLKDKEESGEIRVLVEVDHLLGANPFVPISLIIWELA